jgi:hypothetical protein
MRNLLKIWSLCLSSLLSLIGIASGATLTCPASFDADLCDQLKPMGEGEWVSFAVVLSRPPMDPSTDPKKDSTQPEGDTGATPSYLEEYSKAMFEKYDLRWPEDMDNRATVPAQAAGTYRMFATKGTLLLLGEESYVQQISRWSPGFPVPLARPGITSPKQTATSRFNIKGQRLNQRGLSSFMFRIFPEKR